MIASVRNDQPFRLDVLVGKIPQWVRRFDEIMSRFERIGENGSYALLNKAVIELSPLLQEGEALIRTSLPCTTHRVDMLIRSRLVSAQGCIEAARKKVAARPEYVQKDERLQKRWEKMGLPSCVFEKHIDCVRFLVDSGLLFTIVGYQETCGDSRIHGLKLDYDGHPMVKMQGRFLRWEVIASRLEYDHKIDKIKSRGKEKTSEQIWSYFHPDGLVPVDRFHYEQVFPIYQLSQEAYDRLIVHAKQFYETNPEKDPGASKDCAVQFFTSERAHGIPKHPLFNNLHRNIPVHIGIRLITADRQVYSFGYQMPHEVERQVFSNLLSTMAMTADTRISMLDYEEFRAHEGRMVTSIPLSSQRAKKIIDHLNRLNRRQLRFHYGRQNCSALAHEVMQHTGYEIDTRTTVGATLLGMLPSLDQLPIVARSIAKVEVFCQKIWHILPAQIQDSLKWTKEAVTYIPKKCGILLTNLLILKMGGAKNVTPLSEETKEEELSDKKEIQTFSSVIRHWKDLFKEETSVINHSKYFINWQKKQNSTFIEKPQDRPRLAIVSN